MRTTSTSTSVWIGLGALALGLAVTACGSSHSSSAPPSSSTTTAAAASSTTSSSAPSSTSSSSSATGSTSGGGSATLQVTMNLTGAIKGIDTYTVVEPDTSCTGDGLGSAGYDGVPPIGSGQTVTFNGAPLSYSIQTASYHGPGVYGPSAFSGGSAAISADQASQSDPFGVANNTSDTESMVINADGSGSFTFSGWQDVNLQRTLNGKFTWTCQS